jgi:DnaJ-class molecular chaperone
MVKYEQSNNGAKWIRIMARNYYVVLGVATDAGQEEITAAYRQRAHDAYPSHAGSSPEPFLELQAAYSVLTHPGRRAAYDDQQQQQEQPIQQRQQSAGFGCGSDERSTPEPLVSSRRRVDLGAASVTRDFDTLQPSADDLLHRLWQNFDPGEHPKSEHTEGLTIDIAITPEQAATGGQIKLLFPVVVTCPNCRGHGGVGPYECWRCAGHGALIQNRAVPLAFPEGIRDCFVVRQPLEHFGITNLFLTVRFRVSAQVTLS